MVPYILRTLTQTLVTVLVLTVLVFFATHSLGDPVRLVLPATAPQESVEAMRVRLGVDKPLSTQFVDYIQGLPRLDFGDSLWQRKDAGALVLERLPRTALLAFAGVAWAAVAGVALGFAAAARPTGVVAKLVSGITLFAISSIDFWVALMLVLLFAVSLGWLPVSGYGSTNHLVLPALALGFRPLGRITQITRAAVTHELEQPYAVALESYGLSVRTRFRHVIRNAGIPVLTMIGFEFATIFYGASVVVETVFGWPGVGALLVSAIERRDWPLIVAATAIVSTLVIILHMFLDIFYVALDPRVRHSS